MKHSEARILVFLNNTENRFKYGVEIAKRLNIDYAYLIRLLKSLSFNNLIESYRRDNRVYYELVTSKSKNTLKEALETLAKRPNNVIYSNKGRGVK